MKQRIEYLRDPLFRFLINLNSFLKICLEKNNNNRKAIPSRWKFNVVKDEGGTFIQVRKVRRRVPPASLPGA